ncbi:MAG: hypothetical protein Q8S73_40050 [Deltaproteobacteria bacterium]|nr:hypothetical protein [Myxococcales bacterium]MDP3220359.1 hypothetical protein [Deltaproteobacteria bacterium]
MTLTIRDAFDLPTPDAVTALGFVVRLDLRSDEAQQRQLVDDYVLTPAVRQWLPMIFDGMRNAWERGEDLGRFIHGSFGSGKSHFLSFLGMLLEDSPIAWGKSDPLMRVLADRHRAWIREARFLVVRQHMLTAARTETGFDRTVYDSFNRTVALQGGKPFEFLDVFGIIEEARREAARYGDQFWLQAAEAGIIGSKEDFEALVAGSLQEREDFARAWLEWKGRDAANAGIDPNWAEGLQRLAAHAKAQGYGAVVLLVDEFLLWLSEKSGEQFKRAINQLNVIVDHNDGRRALPLFVFVARQRNLKEFFPDMVGEDQLHQHLDHHSKRFETTTLQDVELRHICKERVLRRRLPEEVQRVVDALAIQHHKLLPTLLQNADVEYLRDVYPFHPALIETLIDISSLMQRERTALRLLYELLVVHYPSLPLGQFLPVGAAFEAIFPEAGVEGSKRVEDLRAVHALYWQRFRPALDQMERDGAESGFDVRRRRTLDQIVKTALLAEISHRLKGGSGMTLERLVQLNDVEVVGETDKGRIARVNQDLVELSRIVRALQVSGTGRAAVVSVVVQGVNFGELMERARAKVGGGVDHRFKVFYAGIKRALKLEGRAEFGAGQANEGELRVKWRGTTRKGSLVIRNVRVMKPQEFKPRDGERFRLVIDYPWDEPGHTVEEDRQRARDARKQLGSMLTVCWLPRHLSPKELDILTELAAADFLTSAAAEEEVLRNLHGQDRTAVVEQARNVAQNMEARLRDILREVYKDEGEVVPLASDVVTKVAEAELEKNLDAFAKGLLDRQFPQHPEFGMEPRVDDLVTLCDWMVDAAEAGDTAAFDDAGGKVLRGLGMPLEIVTVGQVRGTLRRDSRYLKAVLDRTQEATVKWAPIDEFLESSYGLDPEVRSLFLVFVARACGYRVLQEITGEPVEVRIERKAKTSLVLQRASLVDPAEWSRLRELGPDLFGLEKPAAHRTLLEQDRFAGKVREAGRLLRERLQGLHARLARESDASTHRKSELASAIARFAPVAESGTDSCAMLRSLLQQWPETTGDTARVVVRRLAAVESAVNALEDRLVVMVGNLGANQQWGADAKARLETLRGYLADGEQERPLTVDLIRRWNDEAHVFVNEALRQPVVIPGQAPVTVKAPPETSTALVDTGDRGSTPVTISLGAIDLTDGDALGDAWRMLREQLRATGIGLAEVSVVVRKKG